MEKKFHIYTIMTTGRTGSDYLQSCLDNVPGLITLTGKTFFKNFFSQSKFHLIKNNKEKVIKKFLVSYKNLFDNDILENKKINIDKIKFKKKFLKNVQKINLNEKNFISNIFIAFEETTRNHLNKVKSIVNHSHSLEETKYFLKLFPKAKLIVTIRDPLENLRSGIVNWKKYTNDNLDRSHNFFYTYRILRDLNFSQKIKNKKLYVKLENSFRLSEKKKILKFLNLNYSKKINIATYNGIPWIGDKLSQTRTVDGSFNKKVLHKKAHEFFTKKDLFLLKYFYRKYQKFGYHKNKFNFIDKLKFQVLTFFPLSYELKEVTRYPFKIANYYFIAKRIYKFLKE